VLVCQSSWSLPSLLRTIEARPARSAKWIKEIQIDPYLLPNGPAVARILSICTGVVRLVDLSQGPTPFSVLSQLRLERMCISLDIIDGLPVLAEDGSYFHHPAFAQLTHLHLLDAPHRWPHIPFAGLPALTHLALRNYKTQIRPSNVLVLQKILAECPRLEVLVVFIPFCRPEDQNTQLAKFLVDDPRLVISPRSLSCRHDIWDFTAQELCSADEIMVFENREPHLENPWTKVCMQAFMCCSHSYCLPLQTTRRSRRKRTGRRGV
jgi:hypothetical protein